MKLTLFENYVITVRYCPLHHFVSNTKVGNLKLLFIYVIKLNKKLHENQYGSIFGERNSNFPESARNYYVFALEIQLVLTISYWFPRACCN